MKKSCLCVLSACALLLAGNLARAQSIVGTWSGTIQQPGSGSYAGEMTFDSPTSGSSRYPSLGCGGTLSGGGSGGVYRFRETITYGRATATTGGCIDGQIDLSIHGNRMSWSWSGSWQGKGYSASASLQRPDAPQATWSRGEWVRGISVANVLGTCATTWTCQPGTILRSADSEVLHTDSQRTAGACRADVSNPKKCAECLSYRPEASCEYCVQSAQCADPNLGSRTRQALGCCPQRN